MTKEECIADLKSINATGMECIDYAIKALEQQSSDDVMAIHTQGLNEGIRCAMCTNSMKSDKGCDGGCVVDNKMYKKVMETIKSQMFKQPTSDDCVSRAELMKLYYESRPTLATHVSEFGEKLQALPPVTPTRKVGKWIYNRDIQNWECSECSETPKTLGYVGTSAFMTEHFKFCNHCGAVMGGCENE